MDRPSIDEILLIFFHFLQAMILETEEILTEK
jgi:hypothetical protein